nr:hypothetical protein [uncultured Flavobacterium sp.]
MKTIEISFNGYNITTDRNKMIVTAIHDFYQIILAGATIFQ